MENLHINTNKIMETNNTTNSGIRFAGLLTVAFIVLKLVGVINWSWWWILAPVWISAIIGIIILVIVLIIILIHAVISK